MVFRRRLFRTLPSLGSLSLMCVVFGALKIRDRIQTIPLKIILQGRFFFLGALLLGRGAAKIEESATLWDTPVFWTEALRGRTVFGICQVESSQCYDHSQGKRILHYE